MKRQKEITAWLVQDKNGKMRRCIWFNREHATMFQKDYEEVKRIIVSWELAKNNPQRQTR